MFDHQKGARQLDVEHARLQADARASQAEAEKARYMRAKNITHRRLTLGAYFVALFVVASFAYGYVERYRHDASVDEARREGYEAGVQEALRWKVLERQIEKQAGNG